MSRDCQWCFGDRDDDHTLCKIERLSSRRNDLIRELIDEIRELKEVGSALLDRLSRD